MRIINKNRILIWRKKGLWRHGGLWLLIILIAYTLFGFLLTPYLVKNHLINYIKDDLGREASVEKVLINPYALRLILRDFSLQESDGSRFASFEELYINFQLSSLFRWIWTFKEIRLTRPSLRVQIRNDGQFNFAELLPPATDPKEHERDKNPLRLAIYRVVIESGKLDFADESRPTPFAITLDPINFALTDFSSLPDRKGTYSFQATTKSGESLNSTGDIAINPLRSRGRMELAGGKAQTPWRYWRDQLNFEIVSGLIDVGVAYTLDGSAEPMRLALDDAMLTLSELKLQPADSKVEILDVPTLNVAAGSLRWPEEVLKIEQIRLAGAQLSAWLDERGILNWQELLVTGSAEEDMPASVPDDEVSKWQASVDALQIEDIAIDFEDRSTEQPMAVNMSGLNLQVANVSSQPDTLFDFNLTFNVNERGKASAQGKVGILPPVVDAEINLAQLSLLPLQPYLSQFAKLEMTSGSLGVRGKLEYGASENSPDLQFSGEAIIDHFSSNDTLSGERFVGWDALTAQELSLELSPHRLEVAEINIDAPYGRVIIAKDRSVNLTDVLNPTSAQSETESAADPFPVDIGVIRIENGSANFGDMSLSPQFATRIHSLKGEISHVLSASSGSTDVSLEGTVNNYGLAKVSGEINPFAAGKYTNLNAIFRNIELTSLTPYSAKFAGYMIKKGKLSLDLNYQVKDHQLIGDNQIILDKLTLGKPIESPDALDLPIRLAIALLKDAKGRVDIELPVRGDLSDPEFSYGRLVGKAFKSLIAKIVSSPFRLLGALVGADGEDFKFVEFSPDSSELLPPEREKLEHLAEALKQRPKLYLEVRGRYDLKTDTSALKTAKFNKRVATRLAQSMPAEPAKSVRLPPSAKVQPVLGQLYVEQFSANALDQLRARFMIEGADATGDNSKNLSKPTDKTEHRQVRLDAPAFYKTVREELIKVTPVTHDELHQLGQARAAAIKAYLVDQGAIEDGRIAIVEPKAIKKAGQEWIRCKLSLKSA